MKQTEEFYNLLFKRIYLKVKKLSKQKSITFLKSGVVFICFLALQLFNNQQVFAQDPFAAYLNSIPTVAQEISTTNSGTGSVAITTKRFTFKSKGDVNTIYAIMVYPQATGVYPGIMIYHGGGGYAEGLLPELQKFAALGYVTLGIDEPSIANKTLTSSYSTGPWTSAAAGEGPRFNVTGGAQNSTLCDAVVASVEAFNLLSSQGNVDASKMGVTGLSWGGYLTTMISGLLGNKVKAAYSSFGCGFYDAGSFWSSTIAAMSASDRTVWLTYLDAGRRTSGITAPYFIEQPTNDTFFWPEAVQGTLDAIPGNKNRFILANINHTLIPTSGTMKQLFMNYHLKGVGSPFGSIDITSTEPQNDGSLNLTINVNLPAGITVSELGLYYCEQAINWQTRLWKPLTATLIAGTTYRANISANLVNQAVNYYANMVDSRQVQTSSSIKITTPMAVTGITVAPVETIVNIGATQQISATVLPANVISNMAANWTSSNTTVATINAAGLVTGVAVGTATITATAKDGGFTASSIITVTPAPASDIISNCDVISGWLSGNTLTLNTTDQKEGSGCLQSIGSKTDEFKKIFAPALNTGVTAATGKLQFWYYVSDISLFSATNQVEFGSGGAADVNEYMWPIGTLVNGWNLITLPFSTASITGGTPNLSSMNWLRIYHVKTGSVTTKIDNIIVLSDNPNSVNTIGNEKPFVEIYPNPMTEKSFKIKFTGYEEQEKTDIQISTIDGKLVYQKLHYGNETLEIATAGLLRNSVYLVAVRSKHLNTINKLIVQ
jgi:uncharacterized protein YjdB/cephalosporin-C deacetylase-like acetyl esterase